MYRFGFFSDLPASIFDIQMYVGFLEQGFLLAQSD
jgi:hypothetical protein